MCTKTTVFFQRPKSCLLKPISNYLQTFAKPISTLPISYKQKNTVTTTSRSASSTRFSPLESNTNQRRMQSNASASISASPGYVKRNWLHNPNNSPYHHLSNFLKASPFLKWRKRFTRTNNAPPPATAF